MHQFKNVSEVREQMDIISKELDSMSDCKYPFDEYYPTYGMLQEEFYFLKYEILPMHEIEDNFVDQIMNTTNLISNNKMLLASQ